MVRNEETSDDWDWDTHDNTYSTGQQVMSRVQVEPHETDEDHWQYNEHLASRDIGFRSVTEGLHTDGPMGKAMLTIMAAFAQLERDTMIERTRAGLAAAAANGRKGGRPRKVDHADAAKARALRDKGVVAADIAKMLGVSRATAYRYLRDDAVA